MCDQNSTSVLLSHFLREMGKFINHFAAGGGQRRGVKKGVVELCVFVLLERAYVCASRLSGERERKGERAAGGCFVGSAKATYSICR